MAQTDSQPASPPQRPRPRFRTLEVRRVERLTPRMTRVTFGGAELDGFEEPAPTQHIKLIIPEPGQTQPVLPDPSIPRGVTVPGAPRPTMRTFTVRRFEPAAGELDVDFVLHGEGPASRWAAQAQVGGLVAVAGPGGRRYAVDPAAERYLLMGDETALPPIGTLLERLPAGARADVYVEVQDAQDQIDWRSPAAVNVTWLHRGSSDAPVGSLLLDALRQPDHRFQADRVWLATEATAMRQLRAELLTAWQLTPEQIVTRGYWKLGESNYPDHDYGQD